MSASIELQIINKILQTKSLELLIDHALEPSYFKEFQPVVHFILDHYNNYHNVPDTLTVANTFKSYTCFEVTESNAYLADTFLEQVLYRESIPVIQKSAELIMKDANEATAYLIEQLDTLKTKYQSKRDQACDIVSTAKERKKEYDIRVELKGLLGISTGFTGLDQIINGFLPEDFIVILARTNEGKSWLLLFFLVKAWEQGKRVLLYSGEMSKLVVGFRFDTLYKKVSNKSLMVGSYVETKDGEAIDYGTYIDQLANCDVPFLVITPKELNGQELDIPTLEVLIKKHNPDIIGIDQLSLMSDHKQAENKRVQLANISKELYKLTEIYQKPILAVAQANREAAKDKKKNSTIVPGLDQIADSDDIARNATRVLSMGQIEDMLKLKNTKNRYGIVGQEILISFDFNYGLFTEMEDTLFSNNDSAKLF